MTTLFANPTSPFVRIVRMAIHEKGLADAVETRFVDAWADDPAFLDANPAGRVPAFVTADGARLTEAMLILRHLETLRPEPPLFGDDAALSRAGLAVGVFDAAVAVIIGRKSNPDFDTHLVGRKRYRTMRDGLARLDAALPAGHGSALDLAAIAAITALDYLAFRFPGEDWRGTAPRLAAFRDAHADRPSVVETVPLG